MSSSKTETKAAAKATAEPKAAVKKTAKPKATAVKDTINRGELTRAVTVVADVFRSNAMGIGVEGHSVMSFDGEYLRANTFAAAIKYPLASKFKANVNGQTLAKIVGAFESHGADDISVSVKDDTLSISSGRSNVEMIVFPTNADEVSNMSGAMKFDADAETREKIVLAMSQALRASATNDVRYYLNGIHFAVENEKLIVYASDGLTACRINTGIQGADLFNGLSLSRDTAESFIATAGRISGGKDTMLVTRHKNGIPALFGWKFENGAEFCASVLEKNIVDDFINALEKLKGMNVDKLPSVSTPDGLIDALNAGKIAAANDSPVFFAVKDGVMSVKTGDINTGFVYRTTDIATEIKDTEVAYKIGLLLRIAKNPADQILFFDDGPLYIGDVKIYDNRAVGVQTFLMPMRV